MATKRWWGEFHLPDNEVRYWQLGSCFLGIERTTNAWQIANEYTAESETNLPIVANALLPQTKTKSLIFNRYAMAQTTDPITLTPILANRAQVSRPDFPFYIPGQQTVTIYVSSPVWVRIATNNGQTLLSEVPSLRQSDTWFGESNLSGELCYASRTQCRTQLDPAEFSPYRVTTRIEIYNHHDDNLLVQRIKLPLPVLSLFADQNDNLWTETLILENSKDSSGMITNIERSAPAHININELISVARYSVKSNRIIDMFSQIL